VARTAKAASLKMIDCPAVPMVVVALLMQTFVGNFAGLSSKAGFLKMMVEWLSRTAYLSHSKMKCFVPKEMHSAAGVAFENMQIQKYIYF